MEVALPDPCLVILCGPAGCGKSTFAHKHFTETAVVSSDRCRALIADDEQEMRVSAAAFALFHEIIDSRLEFGRLTVADSTALHPDARRELRRIARRRHTPTVLMAFDIPEETCMDWNARRKRRVARAVINRQRRQLEDVLGRVPQEGYDQVVVLGPTDVEHASVRIGRTEASEREGGAAMAFGRIVLAVDGSPPSERAVAVCAELAASLGAAVTIVHVTVDPVMMVPPVAPTEAMIAPPVLTDQALREAETAGERVLSQAAETLRARGVAVATRRSRGPVGQRVVEAANETHADLIVVGSHGHGRLEELLLGSVSDAVARQSRCSVLIVR